MKYSELELKVLQWADEKGILDKGTPFAQSEKTAEEALELEEAIFWQSKGFSSYKNHKGKLVNTKEEIKDAFGDILVTIIIGAKMQNLSLLDCLEGAYDVISKRNGKMVDGQFIKD
jgi:NTP pyrophosphatase (non-canonical NTP hydrolase)